MSRARSKLACQDVVFVLSDAVAFAIPPDVTVVFLFNPFIGETLRHVFDNVRRSPDSSPRRMTVVYKNTAEASEILAEQAWLQRQGEVGASRGENYVVYQAGSDR